jgi:predicted DNA-binding transcriptional regulator AlpA
VKGCDPVGIVEIAQRLGVQRGTVDMWRFRSLHFPEPRWQVGGRPAWDWSDVEAWAKASGRHPA